MTPELLRSQTGAFAAAPGGRPLDADRESWLNGEHGAGTLAVRHGGTR